MLDRVTRNTSEQCVVMVGSRESIVRLRYKIDLPVGAWALGHIRTRALFVRQR